MADVSGTSGVGERLRAVRRLRQLSLEEVERRSGGRWSASAVGAYERGFRTMTLARLQELADFYDVPVAALLGEEEVVLPGAGVPTRLAVDLDALAGQPEATAVLRYVRSIIDDRGAERGPVVAIRAADVEALCAVLRVDEAALAAQLRRWGALVEDRRPTA